MRRPDPCLLILSTPFAFGGFATARILGEAGHVTGISVLRFDFVDSLSPLLRHRSFLTHAALRLSSELISFTLQRAVFKSITSLVSPANRGCHGHLRGPLSLRCES